jgi:hypothetical protein
MKNLSKEWPKIRSSELGSHEETALLRVEADSGQKDYRLPGDAPITKKGRNNDAGHQRNRS